MRALVALVLVAPLVAFAGSGARPPARCLSLEQIPREADVFKEEEAHFPSEIALWPDEIELFPKEGKPIPLVLLTADDLRQAEDWPAESGDIPHCGMPCVRHAEIVVATIRMGRAVLLAWNGRRLLSSQFLGWAEVQQLGEGIFRVGEWWVMVLARGAVREIQIAERYPEDAGTVRLIIRATLGFEADDGDIQSRIDAARELNTDIEAWITKHRLTLEEARHAERRTVEDIARQLGVAYFHAFAAAFSTMQMSVDTGASKVLEPEIDLRTGAVRTGRVPGRARIPRSEDFQEKGLDWPDNDGFQDTPRETTLGPGMRIDRYGPETGRYTSPEGTPFEARALPESYKTTKPLHTYEVIKSIQRVQAGRAAPWFGQRGGGRQFYLPKSVGELIDGGFIREVR